MCVECVNGRSRGEMRFPGKKVPVQVRCWEYFLDSLLSDIVLLQLNSSLCQGIDGKLKFMLACRREASERIFDNASFRVKITLAEIFLSQTN